MQVNYLFFLILVLLVALAASCQPSSPQASAEVQSLPAQNEADQLLLDSIKKLIHQEDWLMAHGAMINFKIRFPDSPYRNELKKLTRKVRTSISNHSLLKSSTEQGRFGAFTKKLRGERDELKKTTFYHSYASTKYINEDAVQLYISVPFDSLLSASLHFTVQNVSALNHQLEYIQFLIEDSSLPYLPSSTYFDKGYGYYWQWFDDKVEDSSVLRLLEKLGKAKDASVQLYFHPNYKHERKISSAEQKSILEILSTYNEIRTIYNH